LCEFVFLICSQSQKTKGRNDADKFKLGFAGMNEKKSRASVDAGTERWMVRTTRPNFSRFWTDQIYNGRGVKKPEKS
jgi:hypothetical protein